MESAGTIDIWAIGGVLTLGYLLGSIPFGLVLTRLAGLGDIRGVGSGNIGATNVLRTGNKPLAVMTLVLDGGKGAAAVGATAYLFPSLAAPVAVAAVLGHLFPIWLRFKGGKGVATTLGALLALAWPVGLLACGTWLLCAALFRYSSLSSLLSLALSPLYAYFFADQPIMIAAGLLAALIFYRHKDNIRRLLSGEETKIGQKS
ncbi:MAG: glycerol-3-phosphate 1-O-acyltransferase PlsY [Rhodospirillaceae bacterium]|jgi:acyl phosphate:glycerol-3-phosphate acyltransferase|nr:glycerol-3-phosphate 1-O-acyltransferase PlsY [Rhodospirillaceae bacterium]MBT5663868.1 glycerol-3-phosphate 1-O-acyltransferase PlsY [Rhodospirillaceae bacterium]